MVVLKVEAEGQEISYSEWWMDGDGVTRMSRTAVAGRKWLLRHSCTEPRPKQKKSENWQHTQTICSDTHLNGGSAWSPILLHSCN